MQISNTNLDYSLDLIKNFLLLFIANNKKSCASDTDTYELHTKSHENT